MVLLPQLRRLFGGGHPHASLHYHQELSREGIRPLSPGRRGNLRTSPRWSLSKICRNTGRSSAPRRYRTKRQHVRRDGQGKPSDMSRFRPRTSPNSQSHDYTTRTMETDPSARDDYISSGVKTRVTPSNAARWRTKVALTVALSVLLGGLVWVWGGGLDVQPTTSSGLELGISSDRASPFHDDTDKMPIEPDTGRGDTAPPPKELFKGQATKIMRKSAASKHLTPVEIDEAESNAKEFVNEALASGKGLPQPNVEAVLPSTCNVVVEGLPFVHPKGQRCCKAKDLPAGALGLQPPPPAGGGWGLESRREGAADGGMVLPGVLRAEKTGEVREKEVSCFPSFIIAGTQKSGTTALTGILEKHPWVRMSMRKELHFFDTKTPSAAVTPTYANNFPRFNASQASEHRAPFVVGEATPFYLASRNACQNMRKLVPDVRLIVLVRDPVKRAYSEYQMKVRRVEEEREMMKLLAEEGAKTVYDCAVQLFPSNPSNLTQREMYFLDNIPAMNSAMAECAGEVGQHGKWMDVMFGIVRRLKEKIRIKSNAKQMELALKDLRNSFNRCFVLKDIAEDLERLYPGGAWRAKWNKPASKPRRDEDLKERMKAGDFRGGRIPMHRKPPMISKRRAVKPQHRDLLDARVWNETDAASNPPDDDDWGDSIFEWGGQDAGISDMAGATGWEAWEPFMSEFVEYPDNVNPDGPNSPLSGVSWDQRGREYLPPWLEEAYDDGAEVEAAAKGYSGWWDDGFRSPSEHDLGGDGFLVSGGVEDVFPERWEGENSRVDYVRRLQHNHPIPRELELPHGTWGYWGQEGPRIFDETCYMRHEEVLPVSKVMRDELRSLTECFKVALGEIGEDLESLTQLNATVAAKTLDDHLSKCFYATPGISNQYIYRSLYEIQAYHCLKNIPREQILLIESDHLRDHPEEVLPRVHEHIGVPDYEYSALKQEDIMAELEKKYPDFEKRTGWRLDSEYKEKMPEDLEKEVNNFMKPHMQIFARLVGQSFGDWAIDDRNQQEAVEGGTERVNELFEEEFERQIARVLAAKKSAAGKVLVKDTDRKEDKDGTGEVHSPPH